MFAHESSLDGLYRRIPLVTIDKVVAARLGQTRVQGNAQPAVFNRQVAMYLEAQAHAAEAVMIFESSGYDGPFLTRARELARE